MLKISDFHRLLLFLVFFAIFDNVTCQPMDPTLAGCNPPLLDDGVMIANKALIRYIPLAAINVTCKAGYYSTTGHIYETMRCRQSPDDGSYSFVYDSSPLICKEGCYAGQPVDFSSTNFTDASPLLHIFEFMRIECAGIVTGWSYYNRLQNRAGMTIFVVIFDRVGLTSFRLANYSVIVTTQQKGWTTYLVPPKFRFRVSPGQVVGIAYENWKLSASDLIIPYRYEDPLTYPTYLGFIGIVNLDGRGEIKIGKDVFVQARGRHPALFSLIAPEEETTTTSTTTTTTTSTTTTSTLAPTEEPTEEPIAPTPEPETTTTSTSTSTSTTTTTRAPLSRCGPALFVSNAFIRSKTFTDLSRVGDKVIYECLEGYQLANDQATMGASTVSIAHCRGIDLSWVDLPVCVLKRETGCGEIPIINGAALVHKSFDGTRSTQTGDAVYFGCLERPKFAPFPPGSELVYCKSDGTWTTLPMCIGAQPDEKPPPHGPHCDVIPVIRNGQEVSRKFAVDAASHVAHVGDKIRFGCNTGFKMRHVDTSTCSILGQWEPLPICDRSVGRCDSTHLIVAVALPLGLSSTHLFYLRQYLKALPRAWTYLTATPATDVLVTMVGLASSGGISVFHHRTPNDPLIRFDDWVDNNVANWPEEWSKSAVFHKKKSGSDSMEMVDLTTETPLQLRDHVPKGAASVTACQLLGPFCDTVGRAIESAASERERQVRLLYISTSAFSLRREKAGSVSLSNAESLLGVSVDALKESIDFESWVYLLSSADPKDTEEGDFGNDAPDLGFLPRGLRRLASKQNFYEQMSTSVELHWELIYPGSAFKHFLCAVTTPNITLPEPATAKATARSHSLPPSDQEP